MRLLFALLCTFQAKSAQKRRKKVVLRQILLVVVRGALEELSDGVNVPVCCMFHGSLAPQWKV